MAFTFYVLLLIQSQGSDDFATREAATAALKPIAEQAEPHLKNAKDHNADIEICRRCASLLDGLREVRAAKWMRWSAGRLLPQIDVLMEHCPFDCTREQRDWLDLWLGKARESGEWWSGHTTLTLSPYWFQFREGTRLWIAQRLRDGEDPEFIPGLLLKMWMLEAAAYRRWCAWKGWYPQ